MCIDIYIYIYICDWCWKTKAEQVWLRIPSGRCLLRGEGLTHIRRNCESQIPMWKFDQTNIAIAVVVVKPNLPTNIVDFGGFDSSRILLLRGGIPRHKGNLPESSSRRILVGIILAGRLTVREALVSFT